jgi:hypothetical protein
MRCIDSKAPRVSCIVDVLYENSYRNCDALTSSEMRELQGDLDSKIVCASLVSTLATYGPFVCSGAMASALLITGMVTDNVVAEGFGMALTGFNVFYPLVNIVLKYKGFPHMQRAIARVGFLEDVERILRKHAADDSATEISTSSADDVL